jgi:hypothetical protein
MKKSQFVQQLQDIVDQLNHNASIIQEITYEDFVEASEQAKKDGHEDPEMTAFLCITHPYKSVK